MLGDHDTLEELRRQLEVVRRRVDETVALLAAARDRLSADGLSGTPAAAISEGKGDLFQLCVRLEVALAESRESAEKLTRRLRELGEADPVPWPWMTDANPSQPPDATHDWPH